jgi:hypothetical protein
MKIESGISRAISFRALDYPRTSQRFFVVLQACFVFGNIAVFVILTVSIRGTASLSGRSASFCYIFVT